MNPLRRMSEILKKLEHNPYERPRDPRPHGRKQFAARIREAFDNDWTTLDLRDWAPVRGPLSPEIGNLTKLTELNLGGLRLTLTSLPPEIGNLINLTSLDLGYNQFTVLPAEIGNLTNLTSLDLKGNQFTTLPPR